MTNAPQLTSATTATPNDFHMALGEGKAVTTTSAIAPLVIANSVPAPIQISKLDDQLLFLKFQSREERSKFIDAYQETTFKTTAYFTTFVDDAVPPSQPSHLSLLTKGNANIEAILQQLNEIWGQENVGRITITVPLSI